MAETTTTDVSTPVKKASVKKPKAKSTHPKTSEMVIAAIKELKQKKGSSAQAIKKYVIANYKVDADKINSLVRRYLNKAVTDGDLVQTKGTGANGSFKLAVAAAPTTKPAPKKKPTAAAKKASTPKKAASKKTTVKKAVKKTATKKTKKEKKTTTKSPKKLKAPKPKKTPTKPKPKKTAPKKK